MMITDYFIATKMRLALVTVGSAVALAVACDSANAPTAATPVGITSQAALSAKGGNATGAVCHLDVTGAFVLLSVNPKALAGHLKHGDGQPGSAVPRQDGYEFGADCAILLTARYVNNHDGTVTDTLTGLVWLQDAKCGELPRSGWTAATAAVAGLSSGECGLTDGSADGDWRLPTITEWTTTVANAVALGCVLPAFTNDVGTACYGRWDSADAGASSSFINVAPTRDNPPEIWWSSTPSETSGYADGMILREGIALSMQKEGIWLNFVWPVRGPVR